MDQPENLYFDVRLRRRALNKGLVTEEQVRALVESLPDLADEAVTVEGPQPALAAPPREVPAVSAVPPSRGEAQDAPAPSAYEAAAAEPPPTAPIPEPTAEPAASGAAAAFEPPATAEDVDRPTPPPPEPTATRLSQPPQTTEVDSAWGEDADELTPATSQAGISESKTAEENGTGRSEET